MTWESLNDVIKRLEDGTPPPPGAGIFGASPRPEDCNLVLLPVPWDATVSYGDGTAQGPEAIVRASHQLDLEDACFAQPFRAGITMLAEDSAIKNLNFESRSAAKHIIEHGGAKFGDDPVLVAVNAASRRVNTFVEQASALHLSKGRIVGVLGGDHSSPFGLIRALTQTCPNGFGILHIDAHHDLRAAYEGFEYSHASIMHNVMEQIPEVTKLVQVGIRDYSKEERDYAQALQDRCQVHYGRDLFRRKANGEAWGATVKCILSDLPRDVYISFDIDGLDPAFCPGTGTPVPGGLSYDEAIFLLEELALSGRRIIGFDLCEVSPKGPDDEWDANVGARILYKLCGATLFSQQKVGRGTSLPVS